jgi:tRNA-(ms[2]io[6]A)-hydroxylase
MLGLKLATDPRWANMVMEHLEDILTDHAYCEQKAASTCISLIQTYPEKTFMVEKLAPVVHEEWSHFRMVLEELKKRNMSLGVQRKDEYVVALQHFAKKGGRAEDRFMDKLLMSALIEARSCERFRLLSEHLEDDYFRNFYRKLMIAEAQHYTLFLEIANAYFPKQKVKERWEQWLTFENSLMEEWTLRGDRVH